MRKKLSIWSAASHVKLGIYSIEARSWPSFEKRVKPILGSCPRYPSLLESRHWVHQNAIYPGGTEMQFTWGMTIGSSRTTFPGENSGSTRGQFILADTGSTKTQFPGRHWLGPPKHNLSWQHRNAVYPSRPWVHRNAIYPGRPWVHRNAIHQTLGPPKSNLPEKTIWLQGT